MSAASANDLRHATHNLWYRLDDRRWRADLDKSTTADVVCLQEAEGWDAQTTLKAYCADHGLGLFLPSHDGNPIIWNPKTMRPNDFKGSVRSHLSAKQMGIDADFNPARSFAWQGFTHIPSGQRMLFINVHPVAKATKPEGAPDHHDPATVSIWKDAAIANYWLDVVSFTADQMSRNTGLKSFNGWWDSIFLGGDFNAGTANANEWYYPGALLPSLYVQDTSTKGLDHLMRTKGSDARNLRRWSVEGHSDHRIHFADYLLREVNDFPREM